MKMPDIKLDKVEYKGVPNGAKWVAYAGGFALGYWFIRNSKLGWSHPRAYTTREMKNFEEVWRHEEDKKPRLFEK